MCGDHGALCFVERRVPALDADPKVAFVTAVHMFSRRKRKYRPPILINLAALERSSHAVEEITFESIAY